MKTKIILIVNGKKEELHINPNRTLLSVLREELGLTGAKHGCDNGECGACTVLLDGKPVCSCLKLAVAADGHQITTIEGLSNDGNLDPIQQAFIDNGAIECGFCTPGMILTAKALLDENPDPTEYEVRDYIKGNLCRCTGYVKIVDAILDSAKRLKNSKKK